jgi:hypothetical protein
MTAAPHTRAIGDTPSIAVKRGDGRESDSSTAVIAAMIAAVTRSKRTEIDSGEMLPLLKRHEIQVLLSVELPLTEIAQRAQVSLATVKRIRDEQPVQSVDDAAEHRRRRIGRPSKAGGFADEVRRWLIAEPDLPTQELLRRAKEKGYGGAKSAFYALVAAARPPRSAPVVRFEGLPGEFSQHDFGQVDVSFVDGRKKRVHFFASRLCRRHSDFAGI